MKKLYFIILAALAVMATACNDSNSKTTVPGDTPQGEPHEAVTNIRYVNMDTLMLHYIYAQEVQTQVDQLNLDIQTKANSYANQLQQRQAQIAQKVQQNLYMSQQSYEQDLTAYQNMERMYSNQLDSERARVASQATAMLQSLQDSINNFIIDFNKQYKYDAILDRSAGLYFNPALDITQDVINGLNKRYLGTKPATTTPAAAPADTTKTK